MVTPLKRYLQSHAEPLLIGVLVLTLLLLNLIIPQKRAFLNFYYLPVILAGLLLGPGRAAAFALACILFTALLRFVSPVIFNLPAGSLGSALDLATWAAALVAAGVLVGRYHDRQRRLAHSAQSCCDDMQREFTALSEAHNDLQAQSAGFDDRLAEVETARRAVEVHKNRVERILYATMDATVANLMIEGRLRSEKRKVSILFSDLVGFTNYSEERSPELVVSDLNSYLSHMEAVIQDYQGHIDKYLGDGIMCEFGAPMDYENYRLLAVVAALKMQDTVARLEHPWQMRIGIASGSAIMGIIGSRRQAYTTIGDVVNLASRMEKNCPPGAVLIDAFTAEGVRRFLDVRMMKDVPRAYMVDEKTEARLDELHYALREARDVAVRAAVLKQIGDVHVSLEETHEAMAYYERALTVEPENTDIKVAYAEASLMRDGDGRLQIKGRKKRVEAYEVLGIRDILLDTKKFPASFMGKYPQVEDLIEIPEEIILPVEALDGCIGHSKVVAVLSFAIAQDMGVDAQERMDILHAAYAADIGKRVIPHHLLNRMGSLSAEELKQVQKHPLESVAMLRKMGYTSEPMLRMVRSSHESYDGSGYPDRLSRDKIPLGARIITVADTYDALTSWRPYRERWDRGATFDELEKSVKKGYFDPNVVKSLINVLS